MKTCCKCGTKKPFDQFYVDKTRNDGVRSNCKECSKASTKAWREANPDKAKAMNLAWSIKNLDRHKQMKRDWEAANPERTKASRAAWQRANSDQVNANTAKRRSTRLQATPKRAEVDLIKIVYRKAKELGSHVDHIVPLKSDIVCGLHCWANLQILPPDINKSKGNHEWPDMP